MRRRFIQILVLSLCAAPWTAVAAAGAAQAALPDFRLLDTTGRAHTIHRYVDASAIVIMAIAPGDPALEAKLTAFAELAASHKDTNVFCFLLAPAPLAAPIAGPAAGIPVLVDDAQIVLPALGLTHAFQCVMAEPVHWGVFYRGDLSGGAAALTAFQSGAPQPAAAPVSGAMLALDPCAAGAVSYTKDIVPILSSRCVACHSEGNIAPFSMDSHRKVAGRAAMIAETVRAARMPPWNADPKFGHFSNAMGLSTIEKRTLLAWIDAGAPKDGDADPLTEIKVARPTGWRLGQPDMVVKLPEPQQIPADGTLEYKYYEVPLDLPEGTWLRGTEVRISQPEVMHHVLVYMRHAGEEIDFTQEYIASYVPGHDPGFFPEGTGKPVPANATLLFQLHYTPNGRAVTDSPELGIYLCKEKPQHEVFPRLRSQPRHHDPAVRGRSRGQRDVPRAQRHPRLLPRAAHALPRAADVF
jgi:hypothetical protein